MNDLLSGLKADLTSRRMLPLVVLAALALIGALAYVALASRSGTPTAGRTPASPPFQVPPLEGPSVSAAPANANAAVAETTAGVSYQHGGRMRNPFQPLPSKETTESGESGSSKSGSSGGGSQGGSSSTSGGSGGSNGSGSGGSGGSEPGGSGGSQGGGSSSNEGGGSLSAYHLDVQLQQLSEEGEPIGKPQVFKDIAYLQPLPSKRKALIAAQGVTKGGKGAAFVLLTEAIMHGKGRCVPSPENCEAIELRLHASEELQYLQSDGSATYYKLTLTKIEKVGSTATAASAGPVKGSAAGSALIARMHLTIPSAADFGASLGTIVGAFHR